MWRALAILCGVALVGCGGSGLSIPLPTGNPATAAAESDAAGTRVAALTLIATLTAPTATPVFRTLPTIAEGSPAPPTTPTSASGNLGTGSTPGSSPTVLGAAPTNNPIPGKNPEDYTGDDWMKLDFATKRAIALMRQSSIPTCFLEPSSTVRIIDKDLADHPADRALKVDRLIYASLKARGCAVPAALL